MESKDVHDLTETIGDCGPFHVFVTIAAQSATVSCVWGVMFMTFGAYDPGWVCLDPNIGNVSFTSDTTTMDSVITAQSLHEARNRGVNKWSLDCAVKENCENLLYNPDSSTIATEFDLTCDAPWALSLIISIQMTGALVGCYIAGQIADKFGRKVSLYLHLAVSAITHIISIFSVSWKMYATIGFFNGYSAGAITTIAYPFPLEFVNEWWRGVVVGIPEWTISFLLFTGVVFLLRNWIHVHIAAAVLTSLVFLTVFWTPESVRWLTVSGNVEKAKTVVTRIARFNGRQTPNTEIIDEIAREEKARMGDHTYTILDIFRISSVRIYAIKFGIIWATMAWIYYGVSFGIKALSGNFFINILLSAILEIPVILFVAPLVNRLGRRVTGVIYMFIEVTCCFLLVIMALTASGNVKDTSILILALVSKMIIVGSWGVCNVYCTELVPTVVRNIHFGYLVGVSRLASILSPYLLPNDPDKLYISFIVVGVLGLLSCGLLWSMPETKGTVLRDTTIETTQDDSPETIPMQKCGAEV